MTANAYIPLMALTLLPFLLLACLKEAAMVALLGAAGTFFGDALAVADSYAYSPHYTHVTTAPNVINVVSVFGSLSLAYGAAVVIPCIQRGHAQPSRMPRLITLTLLAITLIYILIGTLGYVQYGCIAPKNLLLSMSHPVLKTLALVSFYIHIVIAYTVLLNPALYIFERYLFITPTTDKDTDRTAAGSTSTSTLSKAMTSKISTLLSQRSPQRALSMVPSCASEDDSETDAFQPISTPAPVTISTSTPIKRVPVLTSSRRSVPSFQLPMPTVLMKRTVSRPSLVGEIEIVDATLEDHGHPHGVSRLQGMAVRLGVVALQVVAAMLLQSSFDELADFIGATTITLSCILLPVAFYLRLCHASMGRCERVWCWGILISCTLLGCFSSFFYARAILRLIMDFKPFVPQAVATTSGALTTFDFCVAMPSQVL